VGHGVDEGLSQNFVSAMAADRDGFMWIGTANGLNRWNGYEFEWYRYDRDRQTSLSSPTAHALHVDRGGNLWVGTPTGLLVTAVHTSDRDARRPPVGGVEIYRHGMPARAVEIAYGQRDLTFGYVALGPVRRAAIGDAAER